MYLVDTNVLSAGAPLRQGHADLVDWMHTHSDQLFLASMTVAEIEEGIAKLRRDQQTIAKAERLTSWLETVLHLYGDRVLAFDAKVARIAGRLSDAARAGGRSPGLADIIIAATAKAHGLIVLTRNARHFAPLGVDVLNPFDALPTAG